MYHQTAEGSGKGSMVGYPHDLTLSFPQKHPVLVSPLLWLYFHFSFYHGFLFCGCVAWLCPDAFWDLHWNITLNVLLTEHPVALPQMNTIFKHLDMRHLLHIAEWLCMEKDEKEIMKDHLSRQSSSAFSNQWVKNRHRLINSVYFIFGKVFLSTYLFRWSCSATFFHWTSPWLDFMFPL